MRLAKSKSLRFAAVSAGILIITILSVAGLLLTRIVERRIQDKLESAGGSVQSLELSLLRGSLRGEELSINSDSTGKNSHRLLIHRFEATGIGLVAFLTGQGLRISRIAVDSGSFIYNKNATPLKGATSTWKDIDIELVEVKNLNVQVFDDSVMESGGRTGFTLRVFHWRDTSDYGINQIELRIDSLFHLQKGSMYAIRAGRIQFDSKIGSVVVDSFQVEPMMGKLEFARKLQRQETRTSLLVPKILVTGWAMEQLTRRALVASKIEIHRASLWAFRDKRLPFRNPNIALPVELLRNKIKFDLAIDSIRIFDSEIRYEEVAEEGDQPGHITLNHLRADISNFTNRQYGNKSNITMIKASCGLLKSGTIEATFRLPLNDETRYKAEGTIVHGDLSELNAMLEPVALLRVESGALKRLKFDFEYDDDRSFGKVEINYENLRIAGLNKGDARDNVNPFKTLLLNTLVKKDKDGETSKTDRTGAIEYSRDKKRFVAHYWVRSLFSGIQSVILRPVAQARKTDLTKN